MKEGLGGYIYTLEQNNNKITINCQIQINNPVIQSSEYKIIQDFYADLIAQQQEKIILLAN